MKKMSKVILIILMVGAMSTLVAGCGSKQSTTATTTSQTVAVKRGNISVSITAVGNLSLAETQDLAFEVPGTVQSVLVNTGDTVKKGQVLATLDTTDWDAQLTTLQRAVITAQRALTSKQNSLRDDQIAVTNAQYNVTSAQYAVTQAQLNYQSANDTLNQITQVQTIQNEIDNANYALQFAQSMLTGQVGGGTAIDSNYWTSMKLNAQAALTQANQDMKNLLAGTSTTVTSDVELQVLTAENTLNQKQLGIAQAQLNLQKANNALADAQNAIAPAQQDIQNAQDDLNTAQQNLSDAQNESPEVTAPFDGFITSLNTNNAAGGDVVQKGTVAMTIADPTKFEADLLVNETDISKIRLGGLLR